MTAIPGQIIATVSIVDTPGTLLCDGVLYDADDYPELYAVLPDALKVGENEFAVPNMNERVLRGKTTSASSGQYGGTNAVTLLEEHLPAIATVSEGVANIPAGSKYNLRFPVNGGTPHENQPAFMNVRYEIVTGRA